MDDDITELVRIEKRRALRWRDSMNYCHLASFLILLIAAMTAIFAFGTHPGGTMTVPLLGWPWPGWIWGLIRRRNKPRCPACGYNWEINENAQIDFNGDPNIAITQWKCCPGCGIDLGEE